MALRQSVAPTALPVSLVEAKAHLRVDGADDDTLITSMLGTAIQQAEQATGRALMPQTWVLSLDAFPKSLELTRVPVASVSSIAYTDVDGADQVLSASEYTLNNASDFDIASVAPAYGKSWPATRAQVNAVRVTYVAGYVDATKVPESIKSWIKLLVGAMYENREAYDEKQAYQLGFADRLLDRYKIWAL